jgi:hypothetical protein
MIQRTLELEYDKIVIGSDLSALSYCYVNKCPTIYLRNCRPYQYTEENNWQEQITLWNDLAFILSMTNYLPFSDKIVSLRIESDKHLKAVTKNGLVITIRFNELLISDDYNVEGLPPSNRKTSNDNWVIDWFNVNIGCIHPHDIMIDESDNFVKKVYFYISKRQYKNATKKDLVGVSKISDDNLKLFDYSETMARFKILKMMNNVGIKGKWDKTNQRYVKPRIYSTHRDVYQLGKNIYEDLPSNIKILHDSHDKILSDNEVENEYFSFIKKRYGINR